MSQNKINKLLIIGCGGHAKVITDIAKSLGISNLFFKDSNIEIKNFLGNEVLHNELKDYKEYFFVAIGDNFLREKVTNSFKVSNPQAKNATLIHPSSYISDNCILGSGTVVMPLCVINSESKIGDGVILNTKSSIDHDNTLMNFSSIGPGVVTGGNVIIGYRSSISIGAVIKNGIEVGSDSVVGGASFVNKNIPNNCLAYGIPIEIIKNRNANDKYL